jgi:hypothetical protein
MSNEMAVHKEKRANFHEWVDIKFTRATLFTAQRLLSESVWAQFLSQYARNKMLLKEEKLLFPS